jgi:V/A-type H+-transporting ATPase subunit F
MKYYVMGDEDTVLGFDLVGVEGEVVSSEDQARGAFHRILQDEQVGIIIMTERTADFIRPTVNRFLFTERFPLIVEIPDRRGPREDRTGIRELVNAAIGVKI